MEDRDLVDCGYRPLQVLRRTNSSRVVLAESVNNSKNVVLKFNPEGTSLDFADGTGSGPTGKRSISREAEILSSLDHQNVITFLDQFIAGPTAVLVLEFASGGTLCEYIRSYRRLQNDQAQRLNNRLADALSYLHNVVNIAHCDVKSENILFVGDFELKLADFGLAECFTRGTPPRRNIGWKGSPSFAPPEAIRGLSRDPRAGDVWSFGVVVFHMVTGYLPFGTDSVQDILQKMNRELRWPRPLMSVNRDCRRFVELALCRNDRCRPTIRQMMRDLWLLSSRDVNWHKECCV